MNTISRFEEDSGEASRFAKRNGGRRGLLRSQDGQRCAKTLICDAFVVSERHEMKSL